MKQLGIFLLLLFSYQQIYAQEIFKLEKKEVPPFRLFRAEENYGYLKDKANSPYEEDILDIIKFIPLNKDKDMHLSLGGEIRPRFEYFSNRFWVDDDDQNFYSQRLAFYTNIVLNKNFRVFTEFYHGYTSHEEEFVQYDELDFHQLFLELILSVKDQQEISFRFGRQEIAYGATRLIGIREGPNIRRSFDMAKVKYQMNEVNIHAFYGKEVRPLFETFDNAFTFFDDKASNPKLWGIYSQFQITGLTGNNELYYIGFQSNLSSFNDASGNETRHSVGLRRFGTIGQRLKYNSELIYQFGDIDNSTISAFNFETDWHYKFIHSTWTPSIGLKFEYTSGDKNNDDGKINTFNPMFVNPAYYSLAATITPVNLVAVHPSVTIQPTKKLNIYAEYAFFWRATKNDGLYRPPRFLSRQANGLPDKSLGSQFGFQLKYELNRHLAFDFDISYFIAGDFLKETGEATNIFHLAPTVSYKF